MGAKVTTFYHIFQDSAVADGNGTAMDVGGLAGVGVQIEGITTATINFEGTLDESTWYSVQAVNQANGVVVTSVSSDGLFNVPIAGFQQLRCRISGYSAGTIVVTGFGVVNPASVPIAGLPAGENHIGEVGASSKQVDVTPGITSGVYTANDVIGGVQTITGAARVSGKETILQSVVITDLAMQDAIIRIFFFNQNPTNGTYTDNAPLDIHDTDMGFCIGSIEVVASDYMDAADSSVATVRNLGLGLTPSGSANLYSIAQVTETPTYTSTSDLAFKYFFLRD